MDELQISLAPRSTELDALAEQAAKFMYAAKASSTRQAYAADLADFRRFTDRHGLPLLPTTPKVVALYISDLAMRLAVSTIRRRMAAITNAHREAGYADSPASPRQHFVVREVLAGIKRTVGAATHGAEPLLGEAVRRIVAVCPPDLLGIRDRSLILLAFALGARRSELASIIGVRDLTFTDQGLHIWLRRGKTDQEMTGRVVAVPFGEHTETCPVVAIRAWLQAAGIISGPVFRAVNRHGRVSAHALSTRSVAKILKRAAIRAGLDPAHVSPHGLRAGMVTQAAINGAEERDIARVTGHRSTTMVRRYVRDADLFRNNASARLGL
jgi:site-specific recombinase XerD